MLQFRILKIPVQVSLSHLLIIFALTSNLPMLSFKDGARQITQNDLAVEKQFYIFLLSFVLVLLSYLLHELGHAFTSKLLGGKPQIVLYEIGGNTSANLSSDSSIFRKVIQTLSGNFFTLIFIAAITLLSSSLGMMEKTINVDLLAIFLRQFVVINIFIFIMELLPILPQDGGHLMHFILQKITPNKALYYSFILSIVFALIFSSLAFYFQLSFFLALLPLALGLRSFLLLKRQKDIVLDNHLAHQLQPAWDSYHDHAYADSLQKAKKIYQESHSDIFKYQSLMLVNWSLIAMEDHTTFRHFFSLYPEKMGPPFGQKAAFAYINKNYDECIQLLGKDVLDDALQTLQRYHWISASLSHSPCEEHLRKAYQEILRINDFILVIPYLLHSGFQIKAQNISQIALDKTKAPIFLIYKAIALKLQNETTLSKECLKTITENEKLLNKLKESPKLLLQLFVLPEFSHIEHFDEIKIIKSQLAAYLELIDFQGNFESSIPQPELFKN